MLHLVFDLQGVMAGFGDHSVGGQRRAAAHIPRSAVLGVIHACMGIERRAVNMAHPAVAGIHLAVAQDIGGTLEDYHTAQTPKKQEIVLSRRGYQTDLQAVVAAWGNEEVLQQARTALKSPAWTPYLGRRSCALTTPMRPELLDVPTLEAALHGRAQPGMQVHGDAHPAPGFVRWDASILATDRPAATHGDRRTFTPAVRYHNGGAP